MSDIVISVVSVDKTTPQGKKYSILEVMYKNQSFQNKAEEKKLNSYYDKPVFEILQDASKGDVFTVSREKDDNGYWKWVGITAGAAGKSSSSAPTASTSTRATGGAYVADADKQVMIVRQSSLGHAVNMLNGMGVAVDSATNQAELVILVARQFESFVLGTDKEPVAQQPKKTELPSDLDDDLDDLPM